MATYDIYFSGEIAKGRDLDEVKPLVGKLFKVNAKQLERLFSGTPVRIKGGVDEQTASKYRATLRKIGALVEIRESAAAQASAAPTKPAPSTPSAAPPAPQPSKGESGLSMSAVGGYESLEQLPGDRATAIKPPPATPGFEVLPPNTGSLEEFAEEEVAFELPDIEQIPLAPQGTPIDQAPAPPPSTIDTGDLTAAPANTGSLEDCAEDEDAPPPPDISGLKFAD